MVVALLSSLHFFLGKTGFSCLKHLGFVAGKQKKDFLPVDEKKSVVGIDRCQRLEPRSVLAVGLFCGTSRGNYLRWIFFKSTCSVEFLVGTNLTYRNKSRFLGSRGGNLRFR